MQKSISLALFVLVVCGLLLSACTAALPERNSPDACNMSLRKAAKANDEARVSLKEARVARVEAEKFYEQAQALAEKALVSEKACTAVLSKLEKERAARKRRARRRVKRKPVIEESVQTGKHSEERAPKYPKYSPSDAPPGWKGE